MTRHDCNQSAFFIIYWFDNAIYKILHIITHSVERSRTKKLKFLVTLAPSIEKRHKYNQKIITDHLIPLKKRVTCEVTRDDNDNVLWFGFNSTNQLNQRRKYLFVMLRLIHCGVHWTEVENTTRYTNNKRIIYGYGGHNLNTCFEIANFVVLVMFSLPRYSDFQFTKLAFNVGFKSNG